MGVVKFMQKSNVIKKTDFEKYELVIPFISLTGKKYNHFICSELEKRHPCFSDEFAFDSFVKKVTRKGLTEEVYVMNKYKLAEYESRRTFPGLGFYLENLKHWRRFFVERKWKLIFWAFFFCLCLGLSGAIAGKIKGQKIAEKTENDSLISLTDSSEGEIKEKEMLTLFSKTFFSDVKQADGKISRYEWRLEEKKGNWFETVTASLKGVFPENLSGYSGGAVSYSNGLPVMEISVVEKIGGHDSENQIVSINNDKMPNADFNQLLRKIISENEAVLLNEKAPPYHIEFLCSTQKENLIHRILNESALLISKDFRMISSVKIQQAEEDKILIGFSIEEDSSLFPADMVYINLNSISEYLKLFIEESKKTVPLSKKEEVKTESSLAKEQEEKDKKIGEIRRPDNTASLFFKTEEGKIKTVNAILKEDL